MRVDVFVPFGAVRTKSARERAAGIRNHDRLPLVLHREDVGQRTGRVPGRCDDVHCGLAESEFHRFGSYSDIAFRYAPCCSRRPLKRGLPVWRAHHNLRTIPALQQCGTLVVIAVGMADDHVFNVTRIEAKFGETIDNPRLDCPAEIGVDHDDPAAGPERP